MKGDGIVGVETEGFVVILDSLPVLLEVVICVGTVVIGDSIWGVQAEGLVA